MSCFTACLRVPRARGVRAVNVVHASMLVGMAKVGWGRGRRRASKHDVVEPRHLSFVGIHRVELVVRVIQIWPGRIDVAISNRRSIVPVG